MYEKTIKRDGKVYGPYLYKSRKVKGKVETIYLGKATPKNKIFDFIRKADFFEKYMMSLGGIAFAVFCFNVWMLIKLITTFYI